MRPLMWPAVWACVAAALIPFGITASTHTTTGYDSNRVARQIDYDDTPFLPEPSDWSGEAAAPDSPTSAVSLLRKLRGVALNVSLPAPSVAGVAAGPRLYTYPPAVEAGDDLVVTWAEIPSPSWLDFVGIYCGSKATGTDYADLKSVGLFPKAEGSMRFKNLEGRRCAYHVEYIRSSIFVPSSSQLHLTASTARDTHVHADTTLTADERALLEEYLPRRLATTSASATPASAPALDSDLHWLLAAWERLSSERALAHSTGFTDADTNTAASAGTGISDSVAMRLRVMLLERLPSLRHYIKFTVIARAYVGLATPPVHPQHVRLAYTGRADEMWVSFTNSEPSSVYRGQVSYGTAPAALGRVARADSKTYTITDMCALPAAEASQLDYTPPGHMHTAKMTGLTANTRYYYKVGSDKMGWSPVYSFLSAPSPGGRKSKSDGTDARADANVEAGEDAGASENVSPVRFAVMSDVETKGAPRSHTTVSRILHDAIPPPADGQAGAPPLRMVLTVGDISYARGSTLLWDRFMRMLEPISARVPFHVTIGNHDYTYQTDRQGVDISNTTYPGWHPEWGTMRHDSGGECGVPTATRFLAPNGNATAGDSTYTFAEAGNTRGSSSGAGRVGNSTNERANGVFWHAHTLGAARIVAVSSEHDWTFNSTQHRWLTQELQAINRTETPFVVVAVHRPPYTTQLCRDDEHTVSRRLRNELEPLFKRYMVNLVVSGHMHSYERTCPVYDGDCVIQPHGCDKQTGECPDADAGAQPRSRSRHSSGSSSSIPKDEYAGPAPARWTDAQLLAGPSAAARVAAAGARTPASVPAGVGAGGSVDVKLCENTGAFGGSDGMGCGGGGAADARDGSNTLRSASGDDDDDDTMHGRYDTVWRGTVYIVAGNAGASVQQCGFSDKYGRFSVERENVYGYLRVTVSRERLEAEHVRTKDGAVHDRVTIFPWRY